MPDRPAVEEDAFESAPVQKSKVAVAADRGDGTPFGITRHPPRRKGRVVDEHHPRVVGNGGQLLASSSPMAARVASMAASGGGISVSRFSIRRMSGSVPAAAATRSMLKPGICPRRLTLIGPLDLVLW